MNAKDDRLQNVAGLRFRFGWNFLWSTGPFCGLQRLSPRWHWNRVEPWGSLLAG